jgi:glycosyltransferase involved in cell wall biosynthesis
MIRRDTVGSAVKGHAAGISCVICAYNEAGRIGQVLSIVLRHPLIDEVVVVDDGSSDGTRDEVMSHAGAVLISHDRNRGKSQALAAGIERASNPIVMVLDADLVGLTAADISALARPVLDDEADVSISLRRNSLPIYKLLGVDFVSGERVFYKDMLVNHLDELRALPGFGCEAFMNQVVIESGRRIAVTRWPGVTHRRKQQKSGPWKGMLAEIAMIAAIAKVISLKEIVLQNYVLALAARRGRSQS